MSGTTFDRDGFKAMITEVEAGNVLGKTISENYKAKKRCKAKSEELMIFPNTHEAIVDEKRIAKLDKLIKKLYEGNATEEIPDKHFNHLLAEYDTEQSVLEQEATGLKEGITAKPRTA